MKKYKVSLLMQELADAGIENGGCDSTGVVWAANGKTEIQDLPEIQSILLAHNPDGKSWNEIRIERARLLSACDWTQLNDAILSIEEKTAWQEYRQALRDIPQKTFATPDNVIWPIAPGAQ